MSSASVSISKIASLSLPLLQQFGFLPRLLLGIKTAECTFTATTGDLVGTSASPVSPRMTPLQDNGGVTLTHALLPNSPALNAGNTMLTLMVVAAVVNTAISAYYYLRLIVVMFFKERTSDWVQPKIPIGLAAALLIAAIGVLYLGVFADGVIERFSQPAVSGNPKSESIKSESVKDSTGDLKPIPL